jgi:Zn-dependent protease with chaperone function
MGFPVIHTQLRGVIAVTIGCVIVTGERFGMLDEDEQDAVIAHETGHIVNWHGFKRWWWAVSFQWFDLQHRCWEQEYEADAYAAHEGHGVGLISVLWRGPGHESPMHPARDARIEHIGTVLRSFKHGQRLSV